MSSFIEEMLIVHGLGEGLHQIVCIIVGDVPVQQTPNTATRDSALTGQRCISWPVDGKLIGVSSGLCLPWQINVLTSYTKCTHCRWQFRAFMLYAYWSIMWFHHCVCLFAWYLVLGLTMPVTAARLFVLSTSHMNGWHASSYSFFDGLSRASRSQNVLSGTTVLFARLIMTFGVHYHRDMLLEK